MKISLEIKDAPKYRRVETINVNQSVHKGLHISTMVKTIKKIKPWVKIIDIRVDLR